MALAFNKRVVVLVGGVGGAKLAYGLARVLPPELLTVIVNVADDFWHYGLKICPDSDTIMYTLAGVVDPVNGWGVSGDTTVALEMLGRYGGETWFRLGDRDIATHLQRTQMLASGQRLTQVTAALARALGVEHPILPVTDAALATMVDTVEYGELAFQTYFVRHRWQPTVRGLRYAGLEQAEVTLEVAQALEATDAVLFGPSNPWLSLEPVLGVRGLRERLVRRDIPRVAITPIIGGDAVKGPAAKIMRELDYAVSAQTVAAYYGDAINGFVDDTRNPAFEAEGMRVLRMDTLMQTDAHKVALAEHVLSWIMRWDGR
jgi:LPPG:FO 2-phospho-L-lactate transferase